MGSDFCIEVEARINYIEPDVNKMKRMLRLVQSPSPPNSPQDVATLTIDDRPPSQGDRLGRMSFTGFPMCFNVRDASPLLPAQHAVVVGVGGNNDGTGSP